MIKISRWKIRTKLTVLILVMGVLSLSLYWFLWDHQETAVDFLENTGLVTWYDEEQFCSDVIEAARYYTVPESEEDEAGQKAIQPFLEQFADTYMGIYIYGWDDGLYRCGKSAEVYSRFTFEWIGRMDRGVERFGHINAEFVNGEYDVMYLSMHRMLFVYPYVAVSAIFCVALFLSAILIFISRIIIRISRVEDSIIQMAQGDLSHPVPPCGEDEVGIVAGELDILRRTLDENIRRENESRQANQDLITALSHDLRTPLTVLNGYLEVLKLHRIPKEAEEEFIERCLCKTADIKALTDRMFEYVLVYEETETPEFRKLPASVITDCLEENCDFLRLAGFPVETEFSVKEGELFGDEMMIKRIFSNLFSNILKYGDKKRPVMVREEADKGRFRITINNEVRKEKEEIESSQIGLASVRKMTSLHRGEVYTFMEENIYTVQIMLPQITLPSLRAEEKGVQFLRI